MSAGVSEDTSELLLSGWSWGTNTTYNAGWGHWSHWCDTRKVDPISCGVQPFLEFITSLFTEGLEYSSINVIWSAISTTHEQIEGTPIGQHPLVKQLFKGIYNKRPPKPHYSNTWEVSVPGETGRKQGLVSQNSVKKVNSSNDTGSS